MRDLNLEKIIKGPSREGWEYHEHNMTLTHPDIGDWYEIDLESGKGEFIDPKRCLEILYHMSNKSNITGDMMLGLVRTMNQIVGLNGHEV